MSILPGTNPSPDIDMPAMQRASFTRERMLVLPIYPAQAQWLARRISTRSNSSKNVEIYGHHAFCLI